MSAVGDFNGPGVGSSVAGDIPSSEFPSLSLPIEGMSGRRT